MKHRLKFRKLKQKLFLGLGILLLLTGFSVAARTVPDPSNPLAFFNLVADKLLRSTFSFGVTNIPVRTNGVFVYSPAVQRLLQLSANITDAANTNFYPSVFRPIFYQDNSGNVFIAAYQQVVNVNGIYDPQLAAPIDVSALPPGTSSNINVYGVPWIIGAKKGLPNFNQFYMLNTVQVARKLQVNRTKVEAYNRSTTGDFSTNQMFIMSITNNIGFSFWNSYGTNYEGGSPTLVVNDTMRMVLTDGSYYTNQLAFFTFSTNLNSAWPGSAWNLSQDPMARQAVATSFVSNATNFLFLTSSVLQLDPAGNLLGLSGPAAGFNTSIVSLPTLPQLILSTTNWLQAFILDGSNVIDYVEFSGPDSKRYLNNEITDPNYLGPAQVHYMWSTNASGPAQNGPNWGVMNQLFVSGAGSSVAPLGQWISPSNMPAGLSGIVSAEAAFFGGFFTPSWNYNGVTYYNTNLSIQAPFIPSRTVYEFTLWQANDPLVHYLASDLNIFAPGKTGDHLSDDPLSQPLPHPVLNAIGEHYQPWGRNNQINTLNNVDKNSYNLAYRDPLVWSSDNWDFPSTNGLSLAVLGQVHRGTPWQTMYLKTTNIWLYANPAIPAYGTTTWTNWTGDSDPVDAVIALPVADWRLAGLLVNLFNTNDATQLMSVNDPNTVDWLNVLNGISVQTNSTPSPSYYAAPQFDPFIMASNSPQATVIANAIAQNRFNQPGQIFGFAGDILASSQLADTSPWLNTGSPAQIDYAISDEAYEAIPSQLLPLLRPDSVGAIIQTNGNFSVQFSGSDGLTYVFQASTNLVNWKSISTNCPVQGRFILPIAPFSNLQSQYYRSILLP